MNHYCNAREEHKILIPTDMEPKIPSKFEKYMIFLGLFQNTISQLVFKPEYESQTFTQSLNTSSS